MKKLLVSFIPLSFLLLAGQVSAVAVSDRVYESESITFPAGTALLPGCASSYGFSILNGLPCSDGVFTSAISNAMMEQDELSKPALLPGCASSYGFSIFTGQPCSGKATNFKSFVPGGVYLGGWKGWHDPTKEVKIVKIYFSRPLDIGSRGDDVRLLQIFLAQDEELYPEGYVNGYFGINTARAVGRLQLRYGLVKSADETPYGFVGPATRALLNSLQ